MDRHRSFSFKPTRLLFFSFAIFSCILLCFLFYFWVLMNCPSSAYEAHFPFSSSHGGTFLSSSGNVSGVGVLARASFREVSDSFRKILDSIHDAEGTNSSETQLSEDVGSFTEASDSVLTGKDSILEDVHLREGSSSFVEASGSVAERKVINSDDAHFRKTSILSEVDACEAKQSTFGDSCNTSGVTPATLLGNIENERWGACDISRGKWVFDESYPLYSNMSCPFIDEGFSCQANGRTDGDYMKWRWQPDGCNIPRFNAVKMLEMLRGKRLVFVGDSINRNQWESMLCMLRNGVTDPRRVYEASGRKITKEKGNYNFKFADYHCSVEFYVSHFLVHESKVRVGRKRKPTLRIDTIDRSSSKWRGADILVFNTAHWWSHYKTKAGKNYYQEKDQVHAQLYVSTALTRALTTWASWVDRNVNSRKTQVFFRSSAPSHFRLALNQSIMFFFPLPSENTHSLPFAPDSNHHCLLSRGGEWNSGGHCKESTRPLNDTFIRIPPEKNTIINQIVKKMSTPVTLLNITNLSGLRIDGHPSVYGKHPDRRPRTGAQDCSHWCLPGVPDTWNELLYFHLLSKQRTVLTD